MALRSEAKSFDFCNYITFENPTHVPSVGPAQGGAGTMSLLMCKENFVVEPSLCLQYEANEAETSFDLFIECKRCIWSSYILFHCLF